MTNPTGILAELRSLKDQLREINKQRDQLNERAKTLIVDALKAGARPTDVADQSPFTGTYTRNIARAAGIEPGKRSSKPAAR